jgi:glycosyltransferase involved in cell wall biosynthesis
MNVAFCLLILQRACKGDEIDLMIHEPFLSFKEGSLAQDAAAMVHRLMMVILLRAARRVWVSIPAWKDRIQPYLLGRRVPIVWLPIPTNIPVKKNPQLASEARQRFSPQGEVIIGHFGTYGRGVSALLNEVLPPLLLGKPDRRLLLMGLNSEEFKQKLTLRFPELSSQMVATGSVEPDSLSFTLAACDVLIQPYPDGVSSRRTTVMAALAHGIPTVTTFGHLSEEIWPESQAVALAPATKPDAVVAAVESVLSSQEVQKTLTEQGPIVYKSKFDLARTVEHLRAECVV